MPEFRPIPEGSPLLEIPAIRERDACKQWSGGAVGNGHICTLTAGHEGVHVHHRFWINTVPEAENKPTHYWVKGD
jgi:hypothetical protein